MRKFDKAVSIAVVFVMVGVFFWVEAGYALSSSSLRVPFATKNPELKKEILLNMYKENGKVIPYVEEALNVTTEVEIPKGERRATLRLNNEIINKLSKDDLLRIIDILTKNLTASINVHSIYISLTKPIKYIENVELEYAIEKLQIKAVIIDTSKKIKIHRGAGDLEEQFAPDNKGHIKFKRFEGLPQGGGYLKSSILEFLNTEDIRNNIHLSKIMVFKYPIGWGEIFPEIPFYNRNGKQRRLGFVILGGSEEIIDRKEIEHNPGKIGKLLSVLHSEGYGFHYTHYGNLGFLNNDERIVLHDLGPPLVTPRDKISKEELLSIYLRDFVYTLEKNMRLPVFARSYDFEVLQVHFGKFLAGYFMGYEITTSLKDKIFFDFWKLLHESDNKPVSMIASPLIIALKKKMEIDGLADWGMGYYNEEIKSAHSLPHLASNEITITQELFTFLNWTEPYDKFRAQAIDLMGLDSSSKVICVGSSKFPKGPMGTARHGATVEVIQPRYYKETNEISLLEEEMKNIRLVTNIDMRHLISITNSLFENADIDEPVDAIIMTNVWSEAPDEKALFNTAIRTIKNGGYILFGDIVQKSDDTACEAFEGFLKTKGIEYEIILKSDEILHSIGTPAFKLYKIIKSSLSDKMNLDFNSVEQSL